MTLTPEKLAAMRAAASAAREALQLSAEAFGAAHRALLLSALAYGVAIAALDDAEAAEARVAELEGLGR